MFLPTSIPTPTWVDLFRDPQPGLDLTGLRAVAQVISGELLDGISTVTPSVRYLSLRAWIVNAYRQKRIREGLLADAQSFRVLPSNSIFHRCLTRQFRVSPLN